MAVVVSRDPSQAESKLPKQTIPGRGSSSPSAARVLVTGGDHPGPLAAVRALRSAGYEPWVAVSTRRAYAARSRAAAGVILTPDSRSDPEGFVRCLRADSQRLGLSAILGGTDRDLIAIARSRDSLGRLAAPAPSMGALLEATSKRSVNQLALEAGMKVPPTVEVRRGCLHEAAEMTMPAIIKPVRSERESTGGRLLHEDVKRVDSYDELSRTAASLAGERLLIQTFIPGQLGAVCGVAWYGEIVTAVHQVARRIWPPDTGVSAYAETVAPDRVLQEQVASLVRLLAWSGIFQAQFMRADNGAYFIDFNPRIYGSLALAVAAGANLPAIWVSLLTGSRVETGPYRVGFRYRSEELDIRALLHLLRGGRPLAACRGLIPRRPTTHAVANLTDPLPLLTSLAKARRRLTGKARGRHARRRCAQPR